jgi:cytochrome P450
VTTTTNGRAVDLTDVDLFVRGQHHDELRRLRADCPVYWNSTADGAGFWALTRYDDVLAAYKNHSAFGSTRGAILGGSFGKATDTAGGRMLVASDLPRHRLLKQQIHPALSATVTTAVRAKVDELLTLEFDRLLRDGGGDFAEQIATALPAGALMVIMAIGRVDAMDLIAMTRRMVGYRDEMLVNIDTPARLRLAVQQTEILGFFAGLLDERRRRPGKDLVSVLLGSEINGREMSEEDILYNCLNVAVGGNETSSHTASGGAAALIEAPDQWDLLAAEPSLLPAAIDEILRWTSVNAYVQRAVKRDVELGGTLLRQGDSVTLWNVSANRDETQFPEADHLDIRRSPNRHLSYGSGIHRCIGAPIAHAELTLVFEHLLRTGVRLRLAGPIVRMRSNFILGLNRLPVEIIG